MICPRHFIFSRAWTWDTLFFIEVESPGVLVYVPSSVLPNSVHNCTDRYLHTNRKIIYLSELSHLYTWIDNFLLLYRIWTTVHNCTDRYLHRNGKIIYLSELSHLDICTPASIISYFCTWFEQVKTIVHNYTDRYLHRNGKIIYLCIITVTSGYLYTCIYNFVLLYLIWTSENNRTYLYRQIPPYKWKYYLSIRTVISVHLYT